MGSRPFSTVGMGNTTIPDVSMNSVTFRKPSGTILSLADELQYQDWLKRNNVPLSSDYDMRGFWQAQQAGDPNATRAANLHFPDMYKLPTHNTFSNESMYASPSAPAWQGNRLVRGSSLVADEDTSPLKRAVERSKK